jgi:hypothetical protein
MLYYFKFSSICHKEIGLDWYLPNRNFTPIEWYKHENYYLVSRQYNSYQIWLNRNLHIEI